MSKPFAIVTGASSGIGLELAAICAQDGFDLLLAADRPEIHAAADRFRGLGADVTAVETDLATTDGVDRFWTAAAGRPVDASSAAFWADRLSESQPASGSNRFNTGKANFWVWAR